MSEETPGVPAARGGDHDGPDAADLRDQAFTELIASGQPLPADAPPEYVALAHLLRPESVPVTASTGEQPVAGEDAALAAFRAARETGGPAVRRARRRWATVGAMTSTKLAFTALAVAAPLGGVAAAAYTNKLPHPLQRIAHDLIGAPAPKAAPAPLSPDLQPASRETAELPATGARPDATTTVGRPAEAATTTAGTSTTGTSTTGTLGAGPSPAPTGAPEPGDDTAATTPAGGGAGPTEPAASPAPGPVRPTGKPTEKPTPANAGPSKNDNASAPQGNAGNGTGKPSDTPGNGGTGGNGGSAAGNGSANGNGNGNGNGTSQPTPSATPTKKPGNKP